MVFCFFKQKTAYEMRISDWSSDVCSSDLVGAGRDRGSRQHHENGLAALDIKRIVGLKRDEHRAAANLVDQVEPVIEELTEQGKPRVERRRKAAVGRNLGKMDIVAVRGKAKGFQRGGAHSAGGLQDGRAQAR